MAASASCPDPYGAVVAGGCQVSAVWKTLGGGSEVLAVGWIGLSSRTAGPVWGCTWHWHMHGWLAGLNVIWLGLVRWQVPDHVKSHELREALVAGNADVAGPAGGRQQWPGAGEVDSARPGPAPEVDSLAERLTSGE